jgi:predicted flavoprotein YhiN
VVAVTLPICLLSQKTTCPKIRIFVFRHLIVIHNGILLRLVEKHRIAYHERKHGQLFCDDSAKDILAMLVNECERTQQVTIQTHCTVEKITPAIDQAPNSFELNTSKGQFFCQSLVIATGGLSIPTMGATGFGYELRNNLVIRYYPHEQV